jgi:hypothetical protein
LVDYSDENGGDVSGGETEDGSERNKERVNNSPDNEIPLPARHEPPSHNEIEESTTEAVKNQTFPCDSDRGGCDHECQMVKFDYDPEPIIQCSCYKGFVLDEMDQRRCHGECFQTFSLMFNR